MSRNDRWTNNLVVAPLMTAMLAIIAMLVGFLLAAIAIGVVALIAWFAG